MIRIIPAIDDGLMQVTMLQIKKPESFRLFAQMHKLNGMVNGLDQHIPAIISPNLLRCFSVNFISLPSVVTRFNPLREKIF
jgi:hypothetical protein